MTFDLEECHAFFSAFQIRLYTDNALRQSWAQEHAVYDPRLGIESSALDGRTVRPWQAYPAPLRTHFRCLDFQDFPADFALASGGITCVARTLQSSSVLTVFSVRSEHRTVLSLRESSGRRSIKIRTPIAAISVSWVVITRPLVPLQGCRCRSAEASSGPSPYISSSANAPPPCLDHVHSYVFAGVNCVQKIAENRALASDLYTLLGEENYVALIINVIREVFWQEFVLVTRLIAAGVLMP